MQAVLTKQQEVHVKPYVSRRSCCIYKNTPFLLPGGTSRVYIRCLRTAIFRIQVAFLVSIFRPGPIQVPMIQVPNLTYIHVRAPSFYFTWSKLIFYFLSFSRV